MSKFKGFNEPQENWSKLPHQLIDALPKIETIGEMKVVIYTLRHTWGYHDDYKKITLDEFENGRKRKDGSRIDNGTGLTKPTIVDGIKRAVKHGFIFEHTDKSDLARVKKFYSLTEEGLKDFTPDVKSFNTRGKEVLHRSEKETVEKETIDMPLRDENDFPDLFGDQPPVNDKPQNGNPELTEAEAAHLQTFGVLPNQVKPNDKIYAIRQEFAADGWEIHSFDVEMAIAYFIQAVRTHHPKFAIPKDTSTRKLWYKSVAGHLQNYMLIDLQSFYKKAIIKMRDNDLDCFHPGSLTKWALPKVANENNAQPSQNIDLGKGFYV